MLLFAPACADRVHPSRWLERNLTADEAQELIDKAREAVAAGADPTEILYEDFGLEPDYIFDLL